MIGAIAIMWGTKAECAAYQRALSQQGGECKVMECTQSDIEAICNRAWA